MIYFLFAVVAFFSSSLRAQELTHVSQLQGSKIGYYIGSFDPIHIGHQHVIEEALQYVDYVLIYPAPGGDRFKNRTDLAHRQNMIAAVYRDHPKVLFTSWKPKELQDAFAPLNLQIIGIIGSDVVTENLMGSDKELSEKYQKVFMRSLPIKEQHANDTIGALMALKADSFLVALRGAIDLSYLNGKICDRPIIAFIKSEPYSSTEVRTLIKNNQPFEQLVSAHTSAIIKQEGLYR